MLQLINDCYVTATLGSVLVEELSGFEKGVFQSDEWMNGTTRGGDNIHISEIAHISTKNMEVILLVCFPQRCLEMILL